MNNYRSKLKSKNLYEVSNFSFNLLKKYQLFAKKNFGYLAYQKNLNYLHYLYQDCPETKGFADFRVLSSGLQNKLVAGCIHRISTSLLNTETGDTLKISGLHNLMIDKDHRGQGYMLLADALKNDKIFVEITDYGNLSRRKDELIKLLEANNIRYTSIVPVWTDSGKSDRGRLRSS